MTQSAQNSANSELPVRERAAAFRRRLSEGMGAGVMSFPLTAFDAGGRLDLGRYRAHLRAQLAAGPGALFPACGTGEFFSLDEREYAECVRAAVEEADGRVPVVAGVGYGWPQAVRFSALAEQAGADGALLMPHYLVSAPEEGVVQHIREVASRTDLPLIVYLRGGTDLTAPSVERLAEVPSVVGLKDGRGGVERMIQLRFAAPGDWLFFNGTPTAEMQAPSYAAVGVRAYSSAAHCFAPEIAKAFFVALTSGDDTTVHLLLREFYAPLTGVRQRKPGYAVSLVKALARLRGQDVGEVRAPLVEPDPADFADARAILDRGLAAVAAA